jgi:serine phosphatase RsbU (regulator of sigma subunit)
MVSVVCSNALTKSVLEEKIVDTDKILNRTKEIVTEKLSASEKHIQDGMDVALVRISKKNKQQIQFSGANRSLLILGSEGIREIKGDKQPVGLDDRSGLFTAKEMELKQGEEIIMYTDGYSDQFGGEKGKKLGRKRFKTLLMEMTHLSCKEQKERLETFFFEWKGHEEQVDDITVIGVRV